MATKEGKPEPKAVSAEGPWHLHAQALIRHLEREAIEAMVPEEFSDRVTVEAHPPDGYLVVVRDKSAVVDLLQEICDADRDARPQEPDEKTPDETVESSPEG